MTRGHNEVNHHPTGAALVVGDVRDRSRIRDIISSAHYDAVFHLAALAHGRESLTDPLNYFDVNVGGTLNLLMAIEAAPLSQRPTRLAFASTNVVYGSRHVGALSEELEASPENPYAVSKYTAERLVEAYAATGAIGATILRVFNLAGAAGGIGDTDPTRIIPNAFRAITGELPHVTLNGDGSAIRDFVHVLDVATAFRLSVEAAQLGTCRVYNVGSGIGVSMADVIRCAKSVTGSAVPVKEMPAKPEPQALTADISRITRDLGWSAERTSLHEIMADAWTAWPRRRHP
jgi:UDP-glucose 4-epimerase